MISIICHQYDALAIFDFAAVGPYLKINMNGPANNFPDTEFK